MTDPSLDEERPVRVAFAVIDHAAVATDNHENDDDDDNNSTDSIGSMPLLIDGYHDERNPPPSLGTYHLPFNPNRSNSEFLHDSELMSLVDETDDNSRLEENSADDPSLDVVLEEEDHSSSSSTACACFRCQCPRCQLEDLMGVSSKDTPHWESTTTTTSSLETAPCLDPSSSPCAVCMEDETLHRRFANLDCCSFSKTKDTSSTRFCHECLVRCLLQNGYAIPQEQQQQQHGVLVGECPRCKQLLSLRLSTKLRKGCYDCDKAHQKHQRIQTYVRCTESFQATMEEIFWYAVYHCGKNETPGDYHYKETRLLQQEWNQSLRILLVQLAFYPYSSSSIPKELIGDCQETCSLFCQWGILSKVPPTAWSWRKNNNNNNNPCYRIDPSIQSELRTLVVQHLVQIQHNHHHHHKTNKSVQFGLDSKKAFRVTRAREHCKYLSWSCGRSAIQAVQKWNLVVFVRLVHSGILLGLVSQEDLGLHLEMIFGGWTWWILINLLLGILLVLAKRVLWHLVGMLFVVAQGVYLCQWVGSWSFDDSSKSIKTRWLGTGFLLAYLWTSSSCTTKDD